MAEEQRRLAAILVADVVGFSRLTGHDEAGTLARLAALRRDVVTPIIAGHQGRLFKQTGDGFLVEFSSAVQAVSAAQSIQSANVDGDLKLRIGIHVGDVVVQGDDLMGDGVNIAARIEGIADPGGIAVSRQVHDQVRDRLAVAFDDRGEVELKNIGRPVHIFAFGGKSAPATPALALPDKPSIAVLPFQNMSGDPEQEYFADGVVEDIITALSRFKSLFVIARNSTFTYKGKAVDVRQVGRELGVRYVLEGSVRKAAGKVRITGQLIDSETGAHLWADRFDGALEDVFDLQDRITQSVVASVAPTVQVAEIERTRRKPAGNPDAYDCYLRGLARSNVMSEDAIAEALRLFLRAIVLDPGSAVAHAMAARCYTFRKQQGWDSDGLSDRAEARRHALRASELGQDDALALCHAGFALFYVCNEDDLGAALVDEALSLNQNLAAAWGVKAAINLFAGRHEAVLDELGRVQRLNPADPAGYTRESTMAQALLLLGRYEEAAIWANKSLARQPNWLLALRSLAMARALSGDVDGARKVMARLRELHPALRISNYLDYLPYRRREDVERQNAALRLAGLPE